jgi:excisionase family DNA binding protein
VGAESGRPTALRGLKRGLDVFVLLVGHLSGVACDRPPQALLYHCFAYFACRKGKAVDLLKANDVAQRLAVSRAWVYEAARTGRIPSVRIGGRAGPLRFVPEDIDRWLEAARAEWSPAPSTAVRRATTESGGGHARAASHRRPGSKREAVEQQSLL